MKYILKTALVLALVNSVNAADENERSAAVPVNNTVSSYFQTAKDTLFNFSVKAVKASISTFKSVKMHAMPYFAVYSTAKNYYGLANQISKTHQYLTSETFKEQAKSAYNQLNTSKGYKVMAGTVIAGSLVGYGIYKISQNFQVNTPSQEQTNENE